MQSRVGKEIIFGGVKERAADSARHKEVSYARPSACACMCILTCACRSPWGCHEGHGGPLMEVESECAQALSYGFLKVRYVLVCEKKKITHTEEDNEGETCSPQGGFAILLKRYGSQTTSLGD